MSGGNGASGRSGRNGAGAVRLAALSADGAALFDDPMSRVLGMDSRVTGIGAWFGFTSGGTLLMVALMALASVVAWMHRAEAQVAEAPSEVDIMREEAPPPPPPQTEEKKAEPAAPPPRPAPHEAPPPPPPAPAQAGKVLTAESDPNEPVDLTGNTIITGNADSYAGGSTSSNGTSTTAVRGPAAVRGAPTSTAAAAPPPPPPGPDRSHVAVLGGGKEWSCPFPPEADAAQVDDARVMLELNIGAAAAPDEVTVVKDPGYGFGRAAKQCALHQHTLPALDREGNPVASTSQ